MNEPLQKQKTGISDKVQTATFVVARLREIPKNDSKSLEPEDF